MIGLPDGEDPYFRSNAGDTHGSGLVMVLGGAELLTEPAVPGV